MVVTEGYSKCTVTELPGDNRNKTPVNRSSGWYGIVINIVDRVEAVPPASLSDICTNPETRVQRRGISLAP
jgi:hypothetical protein